MAKTLFFFYDVDPNIKDGKSFDFLKIFKSIQQEKMDDKFFDDMISYFRTNKEDILSQE
jgi:hypothetical protein